MKRNKEKGFTLIELLAVIVILAIIALITVPIILNVIYKAEKGAFEDAAYGVIDAGRLHFTESLADTNSFTGKTFDFGTKEHGLKISGEKPGGGTLVLDGEGNQTLAIYDTKKRWCAVKKRNEEKIQVIDYDKNTCKDLDTNTDISIGGVIIPVVNEGDGLYKNPDTLGSGYVYKGKNPHNLLLYDNKCFSIMSIEANQEIKVIYEGPAVGRTCTGVRTSSSGKIMSVAWNGTTTSSVNLWYHANTTIRTTLETLANNTSFLTDFSKVVNHDWNVGVLNQAVSKDTLEMSMDQEKNQKNKVTGWPSSPPYTWTNKIGLINPSDYVKSSSDPACNTLFDSQSGMAICKNGNYLLKSGYRSWTLNAGKNTGTNAYKVAYGLYENGTLTDSCFVYVQTSALRPVLYLGSVHLAGNGMDSTPYIVT